MSYDGFTDEVAAQLREMYRKLQHLQAGHVPSIAPPPQVGNQRWAVLVEALPAHRELDLTGTIAQDSTELTLSEEVKGVDDAVIIIDLAGTGGRPLVTRIDSVSEDGLTATLRDPAVTEATDVDVNILSVADAVLLQRGRTGRLLPVLKRDGKKLRVPVVNHFRHIELEALTLIGIDKSENELFWEPYKADCEPSDWPDLLNVWDDGRTWDDGDSWDDLP